METIDYLDKFQKAADQLDKQGDLSRKKLDCKAGIWLQSAVLKIQKKSWLNAAPTPRPFRESIFFSVWLNESTIREGKLYYNIHALKLRQLTGYTIKSREFADDFRSRFKPFQDKWPNVSVKFGPLTLMEGWVKLDEENLENTLIDLACKFLEIEFILDDLLEERKKAGKTLSILTL